MALSRGSRVAGKETRKRKHLQYLEPAPRSPLPVSEGGGVRFRLRRGLFLPYHRIRDSSYYLCIDTRAAILLCARCSVSVEKRPFSTYQSNQRFLSTRSHSFICALRSVSVAKRPFSIESEIHFLR
eukprot:scaffold5040_cov126-Skeletonema_menzelii.AAC.4